MTQTAQWFQKSKAERCVFLKMMFLMEGISARTKLDFTSQFLRFLVFLLRMDLKSKRCLCLLREKPRRKSRWKRTHSGTVPLLWSYWELLFRKRPQTRLDSTYQFPRKILFFTDGFDIRLWLRGTPRGKITVYHYTTTVPLSLYWEWNEHTDRRWR